MCHLFRRRSDGMAAVYILCSVTVVVAFVFCVVEMVPAYTTGESSDGQASALFLTPLLERGELLEAQRLSHVVPAIANTTSFSGYFTVDNQCESNLFFWFIQADSDWENAPVLLWLQGGPGSSSLFGLFNEIGPFFYEGETPIRRETSWNKNLNLLFIDQPVGTGFSFTGKDCYSKNRTGLVQNLYSAIDQFFQLFPFLKKNNFYIAGESYGGHFVPYIGHYIHKQNLSAAEKINLSGLMIGNGWMDSYYQSDYGELLHALGLVDEGQKNVLDSYLQEYRKALGSGDVEKAYNITSELEYEKDTFIDPINKYNYLLMRSKETERYGDESIADFSFLNRALHVGNKEFSTYRPNGNNEQFFKVRTSLGYDQMVSLTPEVEELLEHYPLVFYFGQLDTVCPYLPALGFFRNLQWSGSSDYQQAPRRRWCVDGQIAGYVRGSHNLYEVLVRNAGHSVPLDQPLWAFVLADSVTSSPLQDPLQKLDTC